MNIFLDNTTLVDKMHSDFNQMMVTAQEMFKKTSMLMFYGGELAPVKNYIFPADKQLNQLEQAIRKEIVTHLAITGNNQLSQMLIFMNVIKDAERIGDYIKNCFEICVDSGPLVESEYYTILFEIQEKMIPMFKQVTDIFKEEKNTESVQLLQDLRPIERQCDTLVRKLTKEGNSITDSVKLALTARYFKRIISHLINILTAIIMPLDKIDFHSENDNHFKKDLLGDA